MARQVWKFALAATTRTEINLPRGAQVVHVGRQNDEATLWAIVEPAAVRELRVFEVVGTGWDFPPGAEYLGTWQNPPYVWHLLEIPQNAEWSTWSGGDDAPVDGATLVDVRLRGGATHTRRPAASLYWDHVADGDASDDIVEWRIAESQPGS